MAAVDDLGNARLGLGFPPRPRGGGAEFALEMAGLLQSGCPVPPADDSREVAAIVIGRPSETERGDDQSERLQRRSTVQIRWDERGDLKGFQNRPAGMSEAPPAGSEMTRPWPKISRPGAQAAGRFIRPGHSRPLKFRTSGRCSRSAARGQSIQISLLLPPFLYRPLLSA